MRYIHRFATDTEFNTYVTNNTNDVPFVSWTDGATRLDYNDAITEKE